MIYAVDGDYLGVPIDSVKPKSSTRLRREDNLAADPRAALLVEHWDPVDWTRLWWVRAHLHHVADPPTPVVDDLAERLSPRGAAIRRQAVPPDSGLPSRRCERVGGRVGRSVSVVGACCFTALSLSFPTAETTALDTAARRPRWGYREPNTDAAVDSSRQRSAHH